MIMRGILSVHAQEFWDWKAPLKVWRIRASLLGLRLYVFLCLKSLQVDLNQHSQIQELLQFLQIGELVRCFLGSFGLSKDVVRVLMFC
jgi:hypothetical protein